MTDVFPGNRGQQSPSADTAQTNEMWRRIGNLESDLRRAQEKADHYESQSQRYRSERDHARSELEMTSNNVLKLQQQLQNAQSTPGSSFDSFKTPEKQEGASARHRPTISSTSSGSFVGPSTSQKGSPFTSNMPKPPHSRQSSVLSTLRFSPLAPRTNDSSSNSTPSKPRAELEREGIKEDLDKYFRGVEIWALQFARRLPTGFAGKAANGALKSKCQNSICSPRDVDELLQNEPLVHYLITAVVNSNLTRYFGPACLDGFIFDGSAELEHANKICTSMGAQNARQCHEVLGQRASLYKRALRTDNVSAWLAGRVTTVIDDIFRIMQPFIGETNHDAARSALQQIVTKAFHLGQRMIILPCEWTVDSAQHGERWDPHSMVQKDSSLDGDAMLTESNGFGVVVRLGISPSVTERDFSSGAMRVQMLHPKTVLVMQNYNQKVAGRRASGAGMVAQ